MKKVMTTEQVAKMKVPLKELTVDFDGNYHLIKLNVSKFFINGHRYVVEYNKRTRQLINLSDLTLVFGDGNGPETLRKSLKIADIFKRTPNESR